MKIKVSTSDYFRSKIFVLFLLVLTSSCNDERTSLDESTAIYLSVEEYKDAVYASWIGQTIGNTYGLCYEFHFIEEPGPDKFPYGYTWTLDELRKYNGAFSDDDTDIEYMYLIQMENHGIEPNYYTLAEAWKKHVKEKVWCANRAALTLMHAGHYPPITGSKEYNPQWMQIDPQLVNEIWAVTAPGMIDYAIDKSEFTAKITNDSFGIEPTLHYAAMYSAAFFEKDLNKLIDIGTSAIGSDSKFGNIVEHVKKLYLEYPNDWKSARKIVKNNYLVYGDYNQYAWPPIDANLNGALGIMALLYGQGDFQKTLDFSCAFGMDADNQAATMCGLLGIVYGLEAIPRNLMFPLENADWDMPFNDTYKMVTRDGLEDATLTGQAKRIAEQGEKIIFAKEGKIIERKGESYYQINSAAKFIPPFEFNPTPHFYTEVNHPFSYPIYSGGISGASHIEIKGDVPTGLKIENETLTGIPTKAGDYHFKLVANQDNKEKLIEVDFTVHSKNLAPEAIKIVFNKNGIDKEIELIRDGAADKTYYSTKKGDSRELDFYGYVWDTPQMISAISYNNGVPQEYCGWFTSFDVEYLDENKWVRLENVDVYPEMNLENSQWLKPNFIDYTIMFDPIKTNGIRIIGLGGGIEKDANNAHIGLQYFTSISELRVYTN